MANGSSGLQERGKGLGTGLRDEVRLVATGPEKLLLKQMASRGKGEAAARPELAPPLASFSSASPPAS